MGRVIVGRVIVGRVNGNPSPAPPPPLFPCPFYSLYLLLLNYWILTVFFKYFELKFYSFFFILSIPPSFQFHKLKSYKMCKMPIKIINFKLGFVTFKVNAYFE